MSQRRPPRHRGFTLMEVLLVLVILVILGSMAVGLFMGTRERANIDSATIQIGMIETSVDLYQLHMNAYPSSLDDLMQAPADAANPTKWSGPYLRKAIPVDPWGNEYQFAAPGKNNQNSYDFWSYGPDGTDGTEDDIGNWESSLL